MDVQQLISRVKRKIIKSRLRPIRVFCCHEVSDYFDAKTTWEGDWISTEDFKKRIDCLKSKYVFLSLSEALSHIKKDIIRIRHYCVLTFDDGLGSFAEIMPWLASNSVPVTVFVNPAYLRKESVREKPMSLLTSKELLRLLELYPTLLSVGSHGYDHKGSTQLPMAEFDDRVTRAESFLQSFPGKIPFFAYPSDIHDEITDKHLRAVNLIPVYCDGNMNYSDSGVIHRELL